MEIEDYDSVIIGAGIAGCSIALSLKLKGQRVLMVDRSKIAASGATGAAGAFLSPKVGKGASLQQLTNEAYIYAKDFYGSNFPQYFDQSGIARMAKDADDNVKFSIYEQYNISKYKNVSEEFFLHNGIKSNERGFWFEDAGVCDASAICQDISKRVKFKQFDVKLLKKRDDKWVISDSEHKEILADNVILATGYETKLVDILYMGIYGLWGSRGDYYTNLELDINVHKKISISRNINGVVKLAATHVRSQNPCMICDGKPLAPLEKQAVAMIDTNDFVIKEIFCGMRSESRDYFPLLGKIIDVAWVFDTYPNINKGVKPILKHFDKLYIFNGVGGRGFVFSPLLAKWLSEFIVDNKEIDSRVNPDRLFLKWARRLPKR